MMSFETGWTGTGAGEHGNSLKTSPGPSLDWFVKMNCVIPKTPGGGLEDSCPVSGAVTLQ